MYPTAGSRLAGLLAGLLLSFPAYGQTVDVDVAAGHTTYPGIRSEVAGPSALAGLRLSMSGTGWGYAAAGAPLGGFTLPWLAAGAGARPATSVHGVSLGAHLALHGYGYDERAGDVRGGGLLASALPSVGFRHGTRRPVEADLYSGLVHHAARGATADSVLRAHDSGLRAAFQVRTNVAFDGDARRLRVEGQTHHYASASVRVVGERVGAWASAGAWLDGQPDAAEVGVGGSVQVGPATRVLVSFRRDAADPFFQSIPRRSWSLGLSHRLRGGRVAFHGAQVRNGSLHLRVPVAESPDGTWVAGDFNGWQPIAMRRVGRYWLAELPVERGVVHYAFQRSDGSWFVPATGHRRVDDGMGGETGVAVVP